MTKQSKSPFIRPSSLEELKLRKIELTTLLLHFQQLLIYVDSDDPDEDTKKQAKSLKSGILKMQRELAWLKSVKISFAKNNAEKLNVENNSVRHERKNIIGKAFCLLCDDVFNELVPVFRDKKELVSHYMILAETLYAEQSG